MRIEKTKKIKLEHVALFPAKSKSTRVPGKNFKKFYNEPMIYWPYIEAKKSKIFDKIFITSDTIKLVKLIKTFDIKNFILRPKKLVSNKSSINSVVQHAIKEIEKKYEFKSLCLIYPTSVLINYLDFKKANKIFKKNKNFFVISVAKSSGILERSFLSNKNKSLRIINNHIFKKTFKKHSQDFQNRYDDCGSFVFGSKDNWIKSKHPYFAKIKGYILPRSRAVDVNDKEDFELVRKLFKVK